MYWRRDAQTGERGQDAIKAVFDLRMDTLRLLHLGRRSTSGLYPLPLLYVLKLALYPLPPQKFTFPLVCPPTLTSCKCNSRNLGCDRVEVRVGEGHLYTLLNPVVW
jgi:hypothetical protein